MLIPRRSFSKSCPQRMRSIDEANPCLPAGRQMSKFKCENPKIDSLLKFSIRNYLLMFFDV